MYLQKGVSIKTKREKFIFNGVLIVMNPEHCKYFLGQF
jgi:hypothetical protein